MFYDVGRKLKSFITASTICGIVLCELVAFILLGAFGNIGILEHLWWIPVLLMFVGPIIFWVIGMFLYGFGELVDNTMQIRDTLQNIEKQGKGLQSSEPVAVPAQNRDAQTVPAVKVEPAVTINEIGTCGVCEKTGQKLYLDHIGDRDLKVCGQCLLQYKKCAIGKCEFCDRQEVEIFPFVIKDQMGTRYRKLCNDCFRELDSGGRDRD